MDRSKYFKELGWEKSPFIKSTSFDIPIIARLDEFEEIGECIGGWDRIMVITAPIGYGKTTFMNQMIMHKPHDVKHVVSFNSYEPVDEVIGKIWNELPFWKRMFASVDSGSFGEIVQKKLGNEKMLLIFDEAQDYDIELFKWLRVLNDRTNNIFMIFLGLPLLEDKIVAEASFRDRKSKSIRLKAFYNEDLEELIKERIKWAGGKGIDPFTDSGIKRLCESCNKVPRRLLDNGQKVVESAAKEGQMKIDADFVEKSLGSYEISKEKEVTKVIYEIREGEQAEIVDTLYDFRVDLSPTQNEIVNLLLKHESLAISELSQMMNKDIRSLGSLIRKLRGLNENEVARKPKVPYPVIVRLRKENRMGRQQYVFSLADNARRLLSRE